MGAATIMLPAGQLHTKPEPERLDDSPGGDEGLYQGPQRMDCTRARLLHGALSQVTRLSGGVEGMQYQLCWLS